ncbi:putative membrane protein [Paenibacillus mucilaginosus]|uniref:DUF2238 domain-containing protein n=1 Tax=Paenibacillus mucilaginosus TaxID=61624 RepID=UPI003D1A6561
MRMTKGRDSIIDSEYEGASPPFVLRLAGAYTAFWLWMAYAPHHRSDWLLENLLVFACLGLLAGTYRKLPLTAASYVQLALFLSLHAYGAGISYGATPLDPWLQAVFGGGRLPYDRLVHLAYGLLLACPAAEVLARTMGLRPAAARVGAVVLILATGAFYELIEMWVAVAVAPELGTLFIGTQGDPWDTQRDMELELYGSAAAVLVSACLTRFPRRPRLSAG